MHGEPIARRRIQAATLLLFVVLVTSGTVGPVLATGGSWTGAADRDRTPAVQEPAHDITFTQQQPGNIFDADATVEVGIETANERVIWSVERYGGQRVANGTVSVDGETTLTLPIDDVGHYTVRAWPAESAVEEPAVTTVAVLPPDDFHNDDAFYGMGAHFNSGWDHQLMGLMERAGVATVRDDHNWRKIERERGVYDLSGPTLSGFMEGLRDHGFQRLPILAYGNPLYTGEESKTIPTTDDERDGYANYTRAVVREYPALERVEVWNEPNIEGFSNQPNGADPVTYARLLASGYDAVQAVDSNVTVVGGSTAGGADFDFWRGVLREGGADHMDAMSIHLYRDRPTGYAEAVERLQNLTREYNDGEALPIWVTEFGWSTGSYGHAIVTEANQARNLVRGHVRLQAAGVERAYWYAFRDDDVPGTEAAGWPFGLVRHPDNPRGAWTPKPSYSAYATMTRQLSAMDFVGDRNSPARTNVFANDETETRVLWKYTPSAMTVRTNESVTVTTMTGRQRELTPRNGEVYLTVGQDPVYVSGNVTAIELAAPVSIDSTGGTVDVSAGAGSDESLNATFTIGDTQIELSPASDETRLESVSIPDDYRPFSSTDESVAYSDRGHRVESVVSVDGETVGWLYTRARPDPLAVLPEDGQTDESIPTTETPSKSTVTSTPDDTPVTNKTTDPSDTSPDTPGTETPGTTTNGPGFGIAETALSVALITVLFGRSRRR